jgi:uncharacterized protein YbjT (DUF2867 family)
MPRLSDHLATPPRRSRSGFCDAIDAIMIAQFGGGIMDREKDVILVLGATGNQGGAVASHLLDHGYRVRGITRHPEGAEARKLFSRGAEVVYGDFDDPSSLDGPLDGVWGVFAIFNTWEAGVVKEEEQGKLFAEFARRRGVAHYVYSSVGSAHRQTGIPHFDNKWRIEETVRSLGFPSYTIIRPVFFMENFLTPWFKPALDKGQLKVAMKPDTPLQMIAVDDIGRFGSLALMEQEKFRGVELDIAGDERTMPETAEIFSRHMGKEIRFVQESIENVRAWSEDFALMLEWFDRGGYNVDIPALESKFGFSLTRLPEWAKVAVGQEERVQV